MAGRGGQTALRCEVCGTRCLVFRYTNGELDVWVCRRHRHVVPNDPEDPQ